MQANRQAEGLGTILFSTVGGSLAAFGLSLLLVESLALTQAALAYMIGGLVGVLLATTWSLLRALD